MTSLGLAVLPEAIPGDCKLRFCAVRLPIRLFLVQNARDSIVVTKLALDV
jgi:hypothetical protein